MPARHAGDLTFRSRKYLQSRICSFLELHIPPGETKALALNSVGRPLHVSACLQAPHAMGLEETSGSRGGARTSHLSKDLCGE